jgi:D-amino-acid dehydrogenase
MQSRKTKVIVIGAGIVGCATAFLLKKQGFSVVVLDAESESGLVTSLANGAQLSYSYVEPLASPSTLKKIPAMLLDPHSPLRLKLAADWAQMTWGIEFFRACTQKQVEYATRAMLQLASLSRVEIESLKYQDNLSFDYSKPGKLVLYDTQASMESAKKQIEFQRMLGCQQTLLNTYQCIEIEPSLKDYQSHIAGGVWTPSEAVGDAKKLCDAMTKQIIDNGGQFCYNSVVKNFVVENYRVKEVVLESGETLGADHFILANGNGAAKLARQLGLSLPVYPVKGYSISLKLKDASKAPHVSVTDLRRKTVYAPLGGRLRVAGMAELVGYDWTVNSARVQFLRRCTEEIFPGSCDFTDEDMPWAGLRPSTPTSMPIIGPTHFTNFLLNVGHGSLGFTLALGSARLITQYLNNQNGGALGTYFRYAR